ncbi:MAG: hypothetical protein M3R47_10930 [Chloroflexota bacterium]|nr:hypothetical protein [Chloroflexota bacterium]
MATQTATAATAIAASWTRTPTPTLTPTSTPTATFTPSPTPTPLGGGNGKLMFFRDSALYSLDIANQHAEVVLSQEQLMRALELEDVFRGGVSGSISPDRKKALIRACGDENCTDSKFKSALVTTDLSVVKRLSVGYIYRVQWSHDSQKFLTQDLGYLTYMIDSSETNFGEQTKIGMAYFPFLSLTGTQIYYYTRSGSMVVNSDGKNKHELSLTALNDYIPYDGIPLPEGIISTRYTPRLNTYAISPDKTQVAFTWEDLLFVADSTDLEFSSPRFVLRLPGSNEEFNISASDLVWGPDNNKILIGLIEISFDGSGRGGDILLANISEGKIETVFSSDETNLLPCGFSPDGNQVLLLDQKWVENKTKSSIVLTTLDDKLSTPRIEFDSYIECPMWALPTGKN